MARKRQSSENLNQLSFDFVFNEIVDTIERMQAKMDIDEREGADHTNQATAATGDRGQHPQTGDNRSDPPFSLVSLTA